MRSCATRAGERAASAAASITAPGKRTAISVAGRTPPSFTLRLSSVLTEIAIPPPTVSAMPASICPRGCAPSPDQPPSMTATAKSSEARSPACSRRSPSVRAAGAAPGTSRSIHVTDSGPMPKKMTCTSAGSPIRSAWKNDSQAIAEVALIQASVRACCRSRASPPRSVASATGRNTSVQSVKAVSATVRGSTRWKSAPK